MGSDLCPDPPLLGLPGVLERGCCRISLFSNSESMADTRNSWALSWVYSLVDLSEIMKQSVNGVALMLFKSLQFEDHFFSLKAFSGDSHTKFIIILSILSLSDYQSSNRWHFRWKEEVRDNLKSPEITRLQLLWNKVTHVITKFALKLKIHC